MNAVKSINAKFNLSLMVIAVLILSIFVTINYDLRHNTDYSGAINESNRLLFIVQRMRMLTESVHSNIEVKESLRELSRMVLLLQQGNMHLLTGDNVSAVASVTDAKMVRLYFDDLKMDEKVKAFSEATLAFVESYNKGIPDNSHYRYLTGIGTEGLSNALSKAISSYERRDAEAIKGVEYLLTFFLLVGLCTIFFLYFFAFKPMKYRLDEIFRMAERKRMEAEEANQMKNEFLATISHEIRSPMSGVLGMAELLASTNLTMEQRNYTRTILNSGETLLRIIEDILDISKIEAGKLEIEAVPTDFLDLMETITLLYGNKARDKGIELALRFVPGTERFVYADVVRVKQIVSNLVDNAIKFTKAGYISITVQEDRRSSSEEDENVRYIVSVQDSGIGIPAAAQEKIFYKFTQADSSTTRLYGGTGLGLSIARQLVELMGGVLSVDSREGEGTTFTFSLCLKRNKDEVLPVYPPADLKGLNILIIDDLEIVRTSIAEQLIMAGAKCDRASSGKQGLAMMQAASVMDEAYDIVLIDYLMPDLNGEMVACAIEDMNLEKSCRKILITGAGNASSAEDLVRRGFSGYIAKPINNRVLLNTVARVRDQGQDGRNDIIMGIDTNTNASEDKGIRQDIHGTKVLLVEDSRVNQAFVMDVLSQAKCDVEVASNGQEAVRLASEHSFDIILMDCQMPVMDGYEASKQINQLKENGAIRARTPIIALTANAMRSDRQKCIDAGMDDYLSKPVRKQELCDKIAEWTGHDLSKKKLVYSTEGNAQLPLLDMDEYRLAQSILKGRYAEALEYFREDADIYIKDMRQALGRGDPLSFVRPVHTLKSSSANFGARALADAAKNLEAEAREAAEEGGKWDADQIALKIDCLEALFHETLAVLDNKQGVAA